MLNDRFVLAFHNQLPELYCNNTVDPGVDRYPEDHVNRCPEGAGGGNVRSYICMPSGEIIDLALGYWSPDRFLEEMAYGLQIWEQCSDRESLERAHRDHIRRHREQAGRETIPSSVAKHNLRTRAHEEALQDLLNPIHEVLNRIENEIYTKGKLG